MNPNMNMLVNALGGGSNAMKLVRAKMDPGVLRPWLDPLTGQSYITVNTGRLDAKGEPEQESLVTNTPAFLTREMWRKLDDRVNWIAKQRLIFWRTLYTRVPRDVPNAMGTLALDYTVASGDADAVTSMDPIRNSERSRAEFDTDGIPLPVIHSDGFWGARDLAVYENGNMPLDETHIDLSARKIGEEVEKNALGVNQPYTWIRRTLYGARTFPGRNTFTMTSPEAVGYEPKKTVDEFLRMIRVMENLQMYGPFAVFYSNAWGTALDGDYSTEYPGGTLRERIQKIGKLEVLQQVDYLPDFEIILVQMTTDVVEAINGMDISLVQWDENGGFSMRYKILCMYHTMWKHDYNGRTGILHASAGLPTTTTTSTTTTTTTTT